MIDAIRPTIGRSAVVASYAIDPTANPNVSVTAASRRRRLRWLPLVDFSPRAEMNRCSHGEMKSIRNLARETTKLPRVRQLLIYILFCYKRTPRNRRYGG
jgi:hypothetical protein